MTPVAFQNMIQNRLQTREGRQERPEVVYHVALGVAELKQMKNKDERQTSTPNKGAIARSCRHCWGRRCHICGTSRAQRAVEVCDAHVDLICHRDTAGENTAPHESLLHGEMDPKLASVDPRDRLAVDDQRGAGDSPVVMEAIGECNPCETGRQGKLQACTAVDNQHSYGDATLRVVLGWSYFLFIFTALA